MNTIFEPIDHGVVAEARETYSARLLTDPQFEEFVSLCAILNREIHRSGSFIEKLENYAFTISRTEKGITAARADTILRDLFKALFGQTMDQLRKQLLQTEESLAETVHIDAHAYALATLKMIEEGDLMPLHRAYAHQATLMATELAITDIAAKRLMSDAYGATEGKDFYEEGKQVEDKFYRPQVEAAKRERNGRGTRSRSGQYNGASSQFASTSP